MGCCLGKEEGGEALAGGSGGGGGGGSSSNRFSSLTPPVLTLPEGGDLSGSGGEGSPGDGESVARQARFASYYGAGATEEEVALRELRRGVVKFNQGFRQVRRQAGPPPRALSRPSLALAHLSRVHPPAALPRAGH